ncbi:hypothetical protein [Cryptosporangium japonicum]|uniref:Acetyltransferase n=1 Tax=Cryptosporangium japonicum TaxID=80872 RepID=A0ABP3D4Q8_9ACTN
MKPIGSPAVSSSRPAGYPPGFERRVTLADGRAAAIRPIVPGDAPALAEAIRTPMPTPFIGASSAPHRVRRNGSCAT